MSGAQEVTIVRVSDLEYLITLASENVETDEDDEEVISRLRYASESGRSV